MMKAVDQNNSFYFEHPIM